MPPPPPHLQYQQQHQHLPHQPQVIPTATIQVAPPAGAAPPIFNQAFSHHLPQHPQQRRIHHARTSSAPIFPSTHPSISGRSGYSPPHESRTSSGTGLASPVMYRRPVASSQREDGPWAQFREEQRLHQAARQEQDVRIQVASLQQNGLPASVVDAIGKNGSPQQQQSLDDKMKSIRRSEDGEYVPGGGSSIIARPKSAQGKPSSSSAGPSSNGGDDAIKGEDEEEDEEEVQLNANGNPIKRRLRANREQLRILEGVFAKNRTPSPSYKKELAQRLGMPHKSILYWFQNRRAQLARFERGQTKLSVGQSFGRDSYGSYGIGEDFEGLEDI
ncbi:UNVERIFIED_CONTAM: hypothetical protein HDU68_004315 [Siphonaria sp. JEL0065]|nr:hypothetical protein HDU68_004315 [Siphonaria sp. JEL0065]